LKTLKRLSALVEKFNQDCPVGTIVTVKKDDGTSITSKVNAPAELLGGHTPVGWVEDMRSCFALERIKKL
jgi:hypothetical protein